MHGVREGATVVTRNGPDTGSEVRITHAPGG